MRYSVIKGKELPYPESNLRIGFGSYGTVHKVQLITGEKYAEKTVSLLDPDGDLNSIALREIYFCLHCSGTNVIKCYDVLINTNKTQASLQLELYDMDMIEFIGKVCKNILRTLFIPVFRELLIGLRNIHSQALCHGDIKPDNILIKIEDADEYKDLKICISDLGAVKFESYNCYDHLCTRYYRAPELFIDPNAISPINDIWSLGITMIVFLTKQNWLLGLSEKLIGKFLCRKKPFPIEKIIAKAGYNLDDKDMKEIIIPLLKMMLKTDPAERATISQLLKYLSYKTIRSYNKSKEYKFTPSSVVSRDRSSMALKCLTDFANYKQFFPLALAIFDNFSMIDTITKNNMNIYMACCMYISSKFLCDNKHSTIPISKLNKMYSCNCMNIVFEIMNKLKFKVYFPTIFSYVRQEPISDKHLSASIYLAVEGITSDISSDKIEEYIETVENEILHIEDDSTSVKRTQSI